MFLAVGLVIALAIAIPTSWLPTILGITITGSGVDVTYNESAATSIFDSLSGDSTPRQPVEDEETGDKDTADSTASSGATSSRSEEAEMMIHDRINQIRSDEGLRQLTRSKKLDDVAQYHSDDMAERGYFSHTGPDGETLGERYREHGIDCAGGENIFRYDSTYGASPETIAEVAVEGWMESPGHRENILRPRFSMEGIGVTYVGGEVYVTQNFC